MKKCKKFRSKKRRRKNDNKNCFFKKMVRKAKEKVIITYIIVRNVVLNLKWNKRNVQDVEIRLLLKKKGKKISEKK